MKFTFPRMSEYEATRLGYISLTKPYHLDHPMAENRQREREWWWRVCNDMRGTNCVIVEYSMGPEIWRHKEELNVIEELPANFGRTKSAAPSRNRRVKKV